MGVRWKARKGEGGRGVQGWCHVTPMLLILQPVTTNRPFTSGVPSSTTCSGPLPFSERLPCHTSSPSRPRFQP